MNASETTFKTHITIVEASGRYGVTSRIGGHLYTVEDDFHAAMDAAQRLDNLTEARKRLKALTRHQLGLGKVITHNLDDFRA